MQVSTHVIMMRKQIPLSDRPVNQKKSFLRLLYETLSFPECLRFEMLNCEKSSAQERDKDMNLETFINNIDEHSGLRVQVGNPVPNLIYGAVFDVRLPANPIAERLAVFEIPYNSISYNMINEILLKSFGSNIESIEGFCPDVMF